MVVDHSMTARLSEYALQSAPHFERDFPLPPAPSLLRDLRAPPVPRLLQVIRLCAAHRPQQALRHQTLRHLQILRLHRALYFHQALCLSSEPLRKVGAVDHIPGLLVDLDALTGGRRRGESYSKGGDWF